MEGIIRVEWIRGADMSADIFTKNLARPLFKKHMKYMKVVCGTNQYMKKVKRDPDGILKATLKGRVLDHV